MKKLSVVLMLGLGLLSACNKTQDLQATSQEKDDTPTQTINAPQKENFSKEELNKQLLEACKTGNLEEVKQLLAKGADINTGNEKGGYPTSPLYLAIDTGNKELIKLIIENGADVNFEDYDCGDGDCYGNPSSPLIKAVKANKTEIAEMLLDNGAELDKEFHSGDDLGMTALRAAVEKDHKNMIDLLLRRGSKDITVALARPDLLPSLLKNGADINKKDAYGETILSIAKKQNKEKLIRLFKQNGAKDTLVEEYPPESDGYFHAYNNIDKQIIVAKQTKDNALFEKLTKYGAEIKDINESLISAVQGGYIDTVRELLAEGADPNTKDNYNVSVLSMAINGGYSEIAKLLINAGAGKILQEKESTFYSASYNGQTEIAEMLLDEGISKEIKEKALLSAAMNGHLGIIKLLVKAKTDINAKGNTLDYTALIQAATYGHTDIVKFLIEEGADVNIVSTLPKGFTALSWAVIEKHTEIVKLLLDAGADITAKTALGDTPLALAKKDKEPSQEIIELLKQAGAKE